jgi:hypothetical protein
MGNRRKAFTIKAFTVSDAADGRVVAMQAFEET